jgi:hypothetical protein
MVEHEYDGLGRHVNQVDYAGGINTDNSLADLSNGGLKAQLKGKPCPCR